MLNPAHVLETALLILAAFLIGATVGTLARLVFRRPVAKLAAVGLATTDAAQAQPVAEAPALITAPTIDPLVKPGTPVAPAEVPTPDFSEVLRTSPAPESLVQVLAGLALRGNLIAPARLAGQTTSGKLVPAPLNEASRRDPVPAPTGPGADVIPFPTARLAESADASTENAAPVEAPIVEPEPIGPSEPPAAADDAPLAEPPAPVAAEPPPAAAQAPAAAEAEPHDAAEHEEAAAMRAIEGNWSPRRRRAAAKGPDDTMPPEPAPFPVAELPGRPPGLKAPRGGAQDSLTNIIGVLPVLETALNRVGVYHFDQIADLTDENVAWVEAHFGIDGRIGREHWREQARELALVSEKAAKSAGK